MYNHFPLYGSFGLYQVFALVNTVPLNALIKDL